MRTWEDFDCFERATDTYLPACGEGETMATQIVTAVCKLVYKWFNDGDVFDNQGALSGWGNDLSSYANWLDQHTNAKFFLDEVWECLTDDDYTELLYVLCEELLDCEVLEQFDKIPKVGSIYRTSGQFRFIEPEEDEDEDW